MISISSWPAADTSPQPTSYQDAFLTPGILPCRAISRKITLEIPKYRIYPRGRPVSWQRFFSLTGDAFLGN